MGSELFYFYSNFRSEMGYFILGIVFGRFGLEGKFIFVGMLFMELRSINIFLIIGGLFLGSLLKGYIWCGKGVIWFYERGGLGGIVFIDQGILIIFM